MRKKFSGINNPRWGGGKKQVKCAGCGKIILRWPSRIKEKNYCNYNCKQKGKHPKTEFKKGHIPWHKGKKTGIIPKNSFLKGSIPWNKDIKRIDIAGKKHWNWRGGITPKILKLRRSFEYKQWRKKVFERDNYTCQSCGKRGGKLEADHIFPFSVLIAELKKIFESNFEV